MGSTHDNKQDEEEEEEAFLYAMQLGSACVLPMVLKSAIELDLLELIKKAGPDAYVSPAQLASHLPNTTKPELARATLDRMLKLLASYSVLNCKLVDSTDEDGSNNNKVERLYSLAPVCKFLTKNEDGVSVAPFLLLNHDKVALESWLVLRDSGANLKPIGDRYHLKDVFVGDDPPFKKAHGMTAYEYTGADPRFGVLFNDSMSNHSTIVMKKILETYRGFQGLNSIVDVAGGIGASLDMIVSRYPSIKGTNFDLPHVVRAAPSYPGVEHVGGDMFVSVPKADAIFMKWVSHNWSDEHVLKLLKNCHEALPSENGKVILVDSISPEMPDNGLSTRTVFHMDVIMMLAQVAGSRQRTELEFQALSEAAGFRQFLKVCRVYDIWIMEMRK